MKLKKLLCVVAAAAFVVPLTACDDDASTVHVYMPDGAPAIALAALMDAGYDGADFTVVPATTIAAKVSSGDADIAVMPINAAATLYNKGVGITMLSVNTHGNLYFVGDDGDIMLSDLVGKRLGVIGRGNVPDLTLRMLLAEQNIEFAVSDEAVENKIAVRYADDGGPLLQMLGSGAVDYALIAEPAATTAVNNLNKTIVADMQELWRREIGGEYPQACVVAKNSLISGNKSFVDKFLQDLKDSDGWAEANPDKALAAVKANMQSGVESTLKTLNASIVGRCNISTVYAQDSAEDCGAFFDRLTQMTTELGTPVLNKVPDENFYYKP